MISCTEFIPLYSELFKYLESIGGHDEVVRYWEYVSDTYVAELLGEEVKQKGIRGCWDYWAKSLNEEACDFTMELDETEGSFAIYMHNCPSKGRLLGYEHMEPYDDYCGHCSVLYNRCLEKYGMLPFEHDYSKVDEAKCVLKYKTDIKKENGEKLHMSRRASDNEYFHRDFHISAKRGLEYVGNKFGDDAVKEYLTRFTNAYYAPLAARIRKNGLYELKTHIEDIYTAEKARENLNCVLNGNSLRVSVRECPGVAYIKSTGNDPTRWYVEMTDTVNRVLTEAAGLSFQMLSYNEENGAAEYEFKYRI